MSKVIRVNQIKVSPDKEGKALESILHKKLCKSLGVKDNAVIDYEIIKKSIDSRHKPDIYYVYSIEVSGVYVEHRAGISFNAYNTTEQSEYNKGGVNDSSTGSSACNKTSMKKLDFNNFRLDKNSTITERIDYSFPEPATVASLHAKYGDSYRPVVIGFGPAGIFCALKLAEAGLNPVVFERGEAINARKAAVNAFWNGAELDEESNVQFGEGGAGTFSDGKLNTGVKDPEGRIRDVLKTFVRFGADSKLLYAAKPHIGTDVLAEVIQNIRKYIISLGGEVHFNSKLTGLEWEKDGDIRRLCAVNITDTKTGEVTKHACSVACLALGHSARDTFKMLYDNNISMTPKSFAVGLRLEHPQEFIDYNAYGDCAYKLPVADYKVTYNTEGGRGVYSFCMCPGGYVVNASSEKNRTAVNGMSYSGRDGKNANSAIIVTVSPQDYGGGVLGGVDFQRKLEEAAYTEGKGGIPVQLVEDFKNNCISTGLGRVTPQIKGTYAFGNLNRVLPEYIASAIKEGMTGFDKHIRGFDMADAVFAGVESRTSSPVRILRDDAFNSSVTGLFPSGEGAGYAGGITSAAVDGVKTAEKINDFLKDLG